MKVLLHICCANCAIYPVNTLRQDNHEVSGYFFNHNIHPYQEYCRRLQSVEEYSTISEIQIVYKDDYLLEDFLANVADNPAARCSYCYQSRLKQTAEYAAASGYNAFSTSLLYSRYQNHNLIQEMGQELGRRYGIDFLYADFRKGWQEGIQQSKAMGLYRQQYCGCIYSEKDRYHPRSKGG